jgi:hypothetical protein
MIKAAHRNNTYPLASHIKGPSSLGKSIHPKTPKANLNIQQINISFLKSEMLSMGFSYGQLHIQKENCKEKIKQREKRKEAQEKKENASGLKLSLVQEAK